MAIAAGSRWNGGVVVVSHVSLVVGIGWSDVRWRRRRDLRVRMRRCERMMLRMGTVRTMAADRIRASRILQRFSLYRYVPSRITSKRRGMNR